MADKFKNKFVLISGAGRGIGKACVKAFLQEGATVIGCSKTKANLTKLAEEVPQYRNNLRLIAIDLSKSSEIDILFRFVNERTSLLHSVINCAGMHKASLIAELNEADYDAVMNVNLKAPVMICRQAIPLLEKAEWATIVNISSLSGCVGLEKFPGFGIYDISKYGLYGLTEILALELKDTKIRVNQISPSGVNTDMFYQAVPPGVKPLLSPEQVARTVLYLAGPDSSPINGENIKLIG